MLGERIADLDLPADPMAGDHVSVKEAVLPFDRFEGSDALLGPEMRSTGEVMGIARDFPTAFAKAQAAAGARCRTRGTAFITVTDSDKPGAVGDRRRRCTTSASGSSPRAAPPRRSSAWASRSSALNKIGEGSPHVVDWIERGDVDLVVNTPTGSGARTDGYEIRRAAVARGIPCMTTLSGGHRRGARDRAPRARGEAEVLSLQELPRRCASRRRPARASSERERAPRAVRPPAR